MKRIRQCKDQSFYSVLGKRLSKDVSHALSSFDSLREKKLIRIIVHGWNPIMATKSNNLPISLAVVGKCLLARNKAD